MKKTFETFVLNMCLSTAQIYDLEILEVLLEHKVEPLCIEVIRICLQNLYIVPVKSRFSSWGLGKPVFAQPTIYAWGFINMTSMTFRYQENNIGRKYECL
jgi:hypothetical protein